MTNSFRGGLLLMAISQGGSAAPRAMLTRRRRRYNFNIEQETARSTKAAEHRGWSLCSYAARGALFRVRNHAITPTAAPPKCAKDETELIPIFCSYAPMIWKRIQSTKTNHAGSRIQ